MFLEDIDSLLTSGNIPDLFDADELNSIFMDLKNDAMLEGISEEKSELYKYLIKVSTNSRLIFSTFACSVISGSGLEILFCS
jgi:dynein heavy chain